MTDVVKTFWKYAKPSGPASRTLTDEYYTMTEPGAHHLHAFLGIIDELFELAHAEDHANVVEELGDLAWFLALAYKDGPESIEHMLVDARLLGLSSDDARAMLSFRVSEIGTAGGIAKTAKGILYGSEKHINVSMGIINAAALWFFLLMQESEGFDLAEILDKNVSKLKIRHPNGFSAKSSDERVDHK